MTRAITGGTGPYVGTGGEAAQMLLGYNASDGANIRFQFDIAKR